MGRSTLLEDAAVAETLGKKALDWLLSTPWWGPLVTSIISTSLLFWWLMRPNRYKEENTAPDSILRASNIRIAGDQYTNLGNNFGHMGPINKIGHPQMPFTSKIAKDLYEKIKIILLNKQYS